MITTNLIPEVSGIYKFTNKLKNKCYIGQAKNLRVRIEGHIKYFLKSNTYFYSSIKKYGLQNFEVEILIEGKFTKQELNQMEITFIRLFKSNNPIYGYNMTSGGDGVSGLKLSEEHKDKIKQANLGKPKSKEAIEKNRLGHLGKKVSEETKAKMRDSAIGRKLSEQHKQKLSKIHKGKKLSQQHKQKLKGKIISEETRQKLRDCKKGKLLSKQHIEKREKTRKINNFKKKLTELFYIELMKI